MALFCIASLGAASARAEDGTGCATFKWSIAREKSAFSMPGLPEVASGQALPGVMSAASVSLRPQSEVSFAHPPARKTKTNPAFGAVVILPGPAAAGRYQVTLSAEAWIDMLQDGQEVRSSGFSAQPDCPGVRKSVMFALKPGTLTVQISGAATDKIKIDVLPAE